MSFCIECGAQLFPGAKFCAECGTKVPIMASQGASPDAVPKTQLGVAQRSPALSNPGLKRSVEAPSRVRPVEGSNPGSQPAVVSPGSLKKATSQPSMRARVTTAASSKQPPIVAAKKAPPPLMGSSPPTVPPPRLMSSADDIPRAPPRSKLTRSSPDVTSGSVKSPMVQRASPKLNIMTTDSPTRPMRSEAPTTIPPPVPRAPNFDSPPMTIPPPVPRAPNFDSPPMNIPQRPQSPEVPLVMPRGGPLSPPRGMSPMRVPDFQAKSDYNSPPTSIPPPPPKFSMPQTGPMAIPAVLPRGGPLSPPRAMSPKAAPNFDEPPPYIPPAPRAVNFVDSPPMTVPPLPSGPKPSVSDFGYPNQAVSPRKEFIMPSAPGVRSPPRAPPSDFTPPIPVPPRNNGGGVASPVVSPRGYGTVAPTYHTEADLEAPPSDIPPPPPVSGKKGMPFAAPTKGWLLDPSRAVPESSGPVLIPIKGASEIIAKSGDTKVAAQSSNEVILTKSTYKVDSSVAPLTAANVNQNSIPKAMPKEQNKRISFQSVVAMAVGHDGAGYQAKVVGHENRTENIDSSKIVTVFKIEVQKGGQLWYVFRRHAQFAKLSQRLKEKKLIGYSELNLPSKKSDNDSSVQALSNYLASILSRDEVATSHYVSNFLQPIQLGDVKPK